MKVTVEYNLPDDEPEMRAALDAMGVLGQLREFQEMLRSATKYGVPLNTSPDDLASRWYQDFCERFQEYLDR